MENGYVTKTDLKEALGLFGTELRAEMAASERRMIELLTEAIRDSETRLLKAFYEYGKASDIRFRKLEADHSNLDTSATQRLAAIELRMVEFEKRLHDLGGTAGRSYS